MRGIVEILNDDILHISDNNESAKFFGLTPDSMQGKLASEMGVKAENLKMWINYYRECKETRKVVSFEYEHIGGNENEWLNATVSYLGPGPAGNDRYTYVVSDITKRKQTEEALKKSEERYRSLIEVSPDSIFINRNNSIIFVNNAFLKLVGATDENQIIGKSPFDLFHPDYHEIIRERLKRLSDGTNIINPLIEEKIVRLDGEIVDVEVTNSLIPSSAEKEIQVILRDITERKRSDEQMRLQNIALESAANAIIISSPDGMIQWVNESFTLLTGFRKDELIGKTTSLLKSGKHDNKFYSHLWETILDGKVWHGEIVNKRKNGTLYTEEMTITPVIDSGKITNFIAVKQDVSKRKLTEEALLKSEEQYRILIETLNDGIIQVDNDDRIQFANKSLCEMFGYNQEELLGKIGLETIIYEQDKYIVQENNRLRLEGISRKYEIRGRKKSGDIIWLSISGAPLKDMNGNVIGSIGVLSDITERKQSEENLNIKTEQLIELNATKDKFFSIIAHDLRNPFHALLNCSDILLDNLNNFDLIKIEQFITFIRNSSRSAYDLLENLLVWARSQTGTIEFKPEVTDLKTRVLENILLVENQAIKKNIQITSDIENDCNVFVDSNMINTVFRNLLYNAIKFTHTNGKIYVSLREIDDDYEISIKDTGIGIAKENIEKLFKVDSKLSLYGTAGEKGTGLGLKLCKEFIEKHNGKIWVESELNEGSNFKFRIKKFSLS
jgi:PAS domain S-box-containing protein